jgi:hypothetical protein
MLGMALQFGPEDQRNINTFSKLNTQLHELNAMMSVQQVCACLADASMLVLGFAAAVAPTRAWIHVSAPMQSNVDDLEDASNELMLVDDEQVPLQSQPPAVLHTACWYMFRLTQGRIYAGHVQLGGGLRSDTGP